MNYPYDASRKTAVAHDMNEITVYVVSDRDLLNEAFRRGLISRFETKMHVDPMALEYDPEIVPHIIKSMLQDVAVQAAQKQDAKKFVELDGLTRLLLPKDRKQSRGITTTTMDTTQLAKKQKPVSQN